MLNYTIIIIIWAIQIWRLHDVTWFWANPIFPNHCQQMSTGRERERLHETVVFTMTQFGDVPLEWKGWTVSNETDPNHGAAHKRLPTVDKPSAKAEANELPAAVHLCHTRGHRLSDFQGAPEAFLNRYTLMMMYSQICVLVNTMSEYIYNIYI
jgi:hypothetical protein